MRILNFAAMVAFAGLAMTSQAWAPVHAPEPASMTLLVVGAAGVLITRLRRRK